MDSDDGTTTSLTPPPAKRKWLQKFKSEWSTKYHWCSMNPKSPYSAQCTICAITFSIGNGGVAQVQQHAETKAHKTKVDLRNNAAALRNFLGASTASCSNSTNQDDNVTASELALTLHAIKHNLSYNSMDCLVKLNKIIYVDSKTALNMKLARTKMEALVSEVLGPYALQEVLNDLNTPDLFYCIQTDASNRKNIKLFPLVAQYFTAKDGIQNKLIDFYENSDESADGMFNEINQSLLSRNLSLQNISALSADNCNANFGVNHSLYTNLQAVIPNIIKGNCHAHIIHNTVKSAMNVLSQDIENLILKVYSHFSSSAVRREQLKKFVDQVEGDWHELKRHVGTRWLSLLPCVDNILKNWVPIRNYFTELNDVDDCPNLMKNILLLNVPEGQILIEIYLHFVSHMLSIFNKCVKVLEGNKITIVDIYNIMQNLKEEITNRERDTFFGYETNIRLRKLEQDFPEKYTLTKKNLLLFLRKSQDYLNKWFDYSDSNWLGLLEKLRLTTKLELPDFEKIIEKLEIAEKLKINYNDMYSEIININKFLEEVLETKSFKDLSTEQKWQQIFSSEYPNTFKVVSFLLSIPATSAYTERVFSLMNIKWREERNRASLQLIKAELMIYCNLNVECKNSYDYFIKNKPLLKKARSSNKYTAKK